jgi:hypothetical protein
MRVKEEEVCWHFTRLHGSERVWIQWH